MDLHSFAGPLLAALNADIVREARVADFYTALAGIARAYRNSSACRQFAVCAATALSNATALAAQVMILGGSPPLAPLAQPDPLPPPSSVEEHLIDARADLAHYQARLASAARLGLLGLVEVLETIVLSKKRHLEHSSAIASAWTLRRGSQPGSGKSPRRPSSNE